MFGGSNSAFRPIQDSSSAKMAGNGKDLPHPTMMSGGTKSLFKRSALSGVADTMFKQIGSASAPSSTPNTAEHSDSNHANSSPSPTPTKSNGEPSPNAPGALTVSLFGSGSTVELILPAFGSAPKPSEPPAKSPSTTSTSASAAGTAASSGSGAMFLFGERMEERVIGVSASSTGASSTKRPRETGELSLSAAASRLDPNALPPSVSPANSPTKRPRRADASDKSDAEEDDGDGDGGGGGGTASDNETISSPPDSQPAELPEAAASVDGAATGEPTSAASESASTTRKEETQSLLESAAKEYQKRQAQSIVSSEEVKTATGMPYALDAIRSTIYK